MGTGGFACLGTSWAWSAASAFDLDFGSFDLDFFFVDRAGYIQNGEPGSFLSDRL